MTEALFRADAYLQECTATVVAVDEAGVVLDRTVFYPEGGGQPGDTGVLVTADGREVAVSDTRKGQGEDRTRAIVHRVADPTSFTVGQAVSVRLDWARRHRLMRMHTCLHLLSAVIIAPVTGGAVGDGYARLDFDLPETPDAADVEARLNAFIAADHAVGTRWITDAELDANPGLVKTMSVAPPRGAGRVRLVEVAGVDLQPCGGTHVLRTAEIGPVRISRIEKKGAKNRRVRLEFPAAAP